MAPGDRDPGRRRTARRLQYANFGVATWNGALAAFRSARAWAALILPIGISFYTFHALSYLMTSSGNRAAPRLADRLLPLHHVLPPLIAGPIVRFHEIRTSSSPA
jgi:alginate O-acetyltransferase complex protein AlgI